MLRRDQKCLNSVDSVASVTMLTRSGAGPGAILTLAHLFQSPTLGQKSVRDVVHHPVSLPQVVTEWMSKVVLWTDLCHHRHQPYRNHKLLMNIGTA